MSHYYAWFWRFEDKFRCSPPLKVYFDWHRKKEWENKGRISDMVWISSTFCVCDFTFTFTFHFHALEKAMATHSSVLCLENPRDGGASWPAVSGVAQSQAWLKQLSSSSSFCVWRTRFTLCQNVIRVSQPLYFPHKQINVQRQSKFFTFVLLAICTSKVTLKGHCL